MLTLPNPNPNPNHDPELNLTLILTLFRWNWELDEHQYPDWNQASRSTLPLMDPNCLTPEPPNSLPPQPSHPLTLALIWLTNYIFLTLTLPLTLR